MLRVNVPAMAGARPDRPYRGTSAEQRRAERRERLIRAAITVYGERGYRNATVKAVCDEAGLTERYFYESFANSEALLAASYRAVVQHLLRRLEEAGEGTDAPREARARAILAAYFDALRSDPRSARLFLVEVAGVSAEIDATLAESLDRFGRLLARTLGAAEEEDRPLLRAGVVGGVLRIATLWVDGGYRAPGAEVVEAALALARLLSPVKVAP